MAEQTDFRTTLIGCDKAYCLELFKTRVNELSEIARNISKEYILEARNYFFQHCESLRDILYVEQECETLEISCSPDIKNMLLDHTDKISIEKNRKNKRPENGKGQVKTVQTITHTNDTTAAEEEKDWHSCKKKLQCFNSVADETLGNDVESIIQEKVYSAQREVTRIATGTAVNEQSHLDLVGKHGKAICGEISQKVDTVEEEAETLTEPFEEMVDIAGSDQEKGQKSLPKTSMLKRNLEGQGNVCDIAKLMECIPELSQYMQVDPKNVTVLKDSEEEAENCLHLSVELDDGTVQEFKIASYMHHANKETEGGVQADGKSVSEEGLSSKDFPKHQLVYTILNEAEKDGPLGRRLRTRKKKAEVKQRGPGRPKNENIPAPEINEKGEAFYRCKECEATVKTYNALIVHMRTHTGSRPFQCSVCYKSFTTKGNMKAHELTTHSENKPWKCEFCNKCFKEKKVLRIHERIHTGEKPYSCIICEKAFSQKSVMVEHMLVHSDNKPHLCDFCGQSFRGASSLKAHKKRHLGLREFQCDLCDKAFVCRNELKRHLLTHTGEKPYTCEICCKAFTRLNYLKEHINLHTGAKPFTCDECGVQFSDTMSLHRHKRKHITESESMLVENDSTTLIKANCDIIPAANTEGSLTLEIPEEMTINGGQTSIQVVVDENTSAEDFQKLQSLLLSATGNAELMMNAQDTPKHLYQVLCVNPDTQEVVGQVEGQEVIVEGQSEDISLMNLKYSVH